MIVIKTKEAHLKGFLASASLHSPCLRNDKLSNPLSCVPDDGGRRMRAIQRHHILILFLVFVDHGSCRGRPGRGGEEGKGE
jgi:hypothetical protein